MRRSQPHSSTSPPLPHGGSLPGFMFMSDKNTLANCLDNNIFGLPRNMFNKMDNIGEDTLLFLANKDTKEIFGVYRPDGRPALNIDPNVYAPLSFPAQIRIQRTRLDSKVPRARLSWSVRFGPLTFDQVQELEEVFAAAAAASGGAVANTATVASSSSSYSRPGGATGHGEPVHTSWANGQAARNSHFDSTEQSHHQRSRSRPAQGSGKGDGKGSGKGDGKGTGKGSGKGESSGKGGSAPASKPFPPPSSSSSSSPQQPLPPDVVVMDLCLQRLDLEQRRLQEERQALHSTSTGTNKEGLPIQPASWTLSWPARYAKLTEALNEAVTARNFVLAASLKQQADDLKAMLEAVAAVANICLAQQYGAGQAASGGGGAAAAAAYCAAADAAALRQDFLTAALLEDAARLARAGTSTATATSAGSRGNGNSSSSVGGSSGGGSSRADPLEVALATVLEQEVGIEPQYAESLFMSGIENAQQLLACDEATLSAWGFKQGIRDKIFEWQAARNNNTSASAATTATAPPASNSAITTGQQHGLSMKSEVALVEAITGDPPGLGLSVSTVDLLRAAGVSTLGALVALDEDALNATGIKKGPRLKIKILCNKLRSGSI